MNKKQMDELYLRTCSIKDLKDFLENDFHTITHFESFAYLIKRVERREKEIERLKILLKKFVQKEK